MRLPHPETQRLIRGEAIGTVEGLLRAGEYGRRQRDGFAHRDVRRQQGRQAACGIQGQPAANGVAMHPQQACHILARVGLSTGQQIEHLQTGLLVAVMLAMLRELAVQDTLDALISPHTRHAITVGECLEALILTIPTGEHALSRVAGTLASYDVEVIFHRPVDALQFHDNRGHAGVPDPHYHIVLWYISPAQVETLQ
jgi:hypothetical protein